MANEIYEIPLEQIRPAPWNPSSRLDPAKVQGMADSIQREGQKVNALVRPVTDGENGVLYELVFGHRRYAAKQLLATKDVLQATLRAEIQEMDAEKALIVSGIENLQRENFSDIEEAEYFQTCGEQYGELAVGILSEKLSISPRYIRKRIEALKLPEKALELWRDGVWHAGHMEQLLRLGDNETVISLLESVEEEDGFEETTAGRLKSIIDRVALPLHSGFFKKDDCKSCRQNTDCQRSLFGDEIGEAAKCLDQECFAQKQQAWLGVNWPTCKQNIFWTQAAVIGNWNTPTTGEFNDWGLKPAEKCLSCSHFTTILALERERNHRDRVCMGEASCFAGIKRATSGGNGKKEKDPNGPRVAWHGEFYRQEFYGREVPTLVENLGDDDPRRLQLALAAIIYSASGIHEWFCEKVGIEVKKEHEHESYFFKLDFPTILKHTQAMTASQAEKLMAEALVKIALRKERGYETSFADQDRQAIAEFLEVDFENFLVTEEYLKKKTKAELVRFIAHESGLLDEDEFKKAMSQRGFSTAANLAQAKKGVLVDIILNSGVDLRGRLPQEIADRPQL